MRSTILFVAILLMSISASSQQLNDYKYVVVPESFGFSKEMDQYQLNSLAKFLFAKYGFQAFMKKEAKPADLNENACLALYSEVEDKSGLFVTKLKMRLKDCRGTTLYETDYGTSRIKDYKKANQEALRDAFGALEGLNYKYTPSIPVAESKEEVKPAEVVVVATPNAQGDVSSEVVEVAKEVEDLSEGSTLEDKKWYTNADGLFYLEIIDNGYSIFQKGMVEPFATLIKSDATDSYIYNTLTKQGLAYFDENANLVVEHFDRNQKKTVKTIYQLKN